MSELPHPKDLMSAYLPANDGYMELSVSEPLEKKATLGDYHEYPITGRDSLGAIECFRRYSDFVTFHKVLLERFPGLYIPPIPPKAQDKKGAATLEERRYFLDLFLKESVSLPYLVASPEMQTFLRPTGEVDKALSKLYRVRASELLTVYRSTIRIPEVSKWIILTFIRTLTTNQSEISMKR